MARIHSGLGASGAASCARCVCVAILCWAITLGCSPTSRDRLKHFFFEIPDEEATATANESPVVVPVAQPPRLQLPEARFTSIHVPFAQRQCSECHDAAQIMEVGDQFLNSCGTCHPSYFTESATHDPVAVGECVACHEMHRSEQPALLLMPGNELCIDCHEEPEDLSEPAHAGEDASECLRCHDPHFGGAGLLRAGVR